MQYFAHTLKACGPFALALVLSACGDKTSSADTSASNSNNGLNSELAARGIDGSGQLAQTPVQSTIDQQFSTPGSESAPVEPPQTQELSGDPLVTLIATTSSSLNSSGTQLEWSSENVDQCETSGAWEGSVDTSGVVSLNHDEAGEQTYLISCQGPQGTAMAMVTVTVESTSLAWQAPASNTDGSELTDLAGYNLYYGTESGRYSQVKPLRDPSKTSFELPVEPGTYYLAMTAYDASGNESELSNEIMRTVR